jgi:hypothetical protein
MKAYIVKLEVMQYSECQSSLSPENKSAAASSHNDVEAELKCMKGNNVILRHERDENGPKF